jgi:excinuclease ABC subunit A
MILFSVTAPAQKQEQAFLQSLLLRGFTRVQCGAEILDLHEIHALPKTRPDHLYVILDRLVIREDNRSRLVEAIETAFREGEGLCRVEVINQGPRIYSTDFRCQQCGRTFEPIRPVLFSFNHPLGACPECKGFGNILRYDPDLVIPDHGKSLTQGAIEPWSKPSGDWWQKQMLLSMKRRGVDLTLPYKHLPQPIQQILWQGEGKMEGVQHFFEYLEGKRYKLHVRVMLSRYRTPIPCPTCDGSRLRPEARYVKIAGTDIHELSMLTIEEAAAWITSLTLSPYDNQVARDILRQLTAKLGFLLRMGLSYLTLSRQTRTLSGGEAQRAALANQLGAHLVGTLYVLDEPTIGLHPRDTATLASILRELASQGNTVVVVEHDRQMMQAADYLVELGPLSGEKGGEVICAAPQREFITDRRSITARYLRGEDEVSTPRSRRRGNGKFLVIAGACEHNLKDLFIRIPLGMLICVTGVSGSGKSTLVEDTLYRAIARAFRVESLPMGKFRAIKGIEHLTGIRLIDQEPIGRTPRSNPITYLKAFDEVRSLFASERDALRRGLTPGHFSFNTTGGRCDRCQGSGVEKLEMYFFEDIYATCEACDGRRFKPDVLSIRYRGKTIHDVLQMTVEEALGFFSGSPKLTEKLRLLSSIGLGYLRLGQSATTLSGGEAQRLKIAAELKDSSAKNVLYIMDEPTTGLHVEDIKKLLAILQKLVDSGNTLVVVEHNLDIIKSADWIIDLGPEGGAAGGHIVAEGRPEQVARVTASHTGQFLAPLLPDEESTRERL